MDVKEFRYDRVLFIGSFAQGPFADELFKKKTCTQYAANTVEKYYIDGLIETLQANTDILSALVTVPYPHSRDLFIPGDKTHYKNTEIVNVGFLNLPYMNQVTQGYSLNKYAKQWAKKHKSQKVLVVVYSLRVAYLKAAKKIKQINPDAVIINIVPDLPQYMHGAVSRIRDFLTSVNSRLIDRLRSCVDGYVLYTEAMAEALRLKRKPWTVIEGIYDPLKNPAAEENGGDGKCDRFVYLYAGGVSEKYGLKLLANGFLRAKIPNAELHIYGKGDFARQLHKLAEENPSIRYWGAVAPSVAQVKMRQADVLVNPRPSCNDFTKYSCPSKVIEYMATGRAALLTKLPGIPKEYFDYVFTIDDESEKGMADAMKHVYEVGEAVRAGKGKQAQEFICQKKNLAEQMKKLAKLLEEIESEDGVKHG